MSLTLGDRIRAYVSISGVIMPTEVIVVIFWGRTCPIAGTWYTEVALLGTRDAESMRLRESVGTDTRALELANPWAWYYSQKPITSLIVRDSLASPIIGWIKITITQQDTSFAQNHSKDIYSYSLPGWNIPSTSLRGSIFKKTREEVTSRP